MTFGRKPITIVEIDVDFCALTYGTAPCTAALSAATPRKCFNTFKTCQDQANFDQGTLTLDAQLATLPDPSWTPLHEEYQFGSYHREFRISEDIDAGRVSAKMRGGVLELDLPKSAERQPRAIPIQTG